MIQKSILFLAFWATSYFSIASAQVTIGSEIAPVKGALLDLKEFNDEIANEGGRTANKGLGMPRTSILSPTQLELKNYTGASLDKAEHIGLLIYNIAQKDGSDITNNEDMICPGLHVWTGERWTPLTPYPKTGLTCIGNLFPPATITGTDELHFASGKDERGTTIANQDVNLTWTPTTSAVSMVKSNVVVNGTVLPQIVFGTEPPTSIAEGGTNNYTLAVASMTDAEITSNLFATKAVNLTFTAFSENNEPATFTSTVYQTNFALTTDGKQEDKIIRRVTNGSTNIAVSANVKWNAVLGDATQSSISVASGGAYTNTNAATYNQTLTLTQSRNETSLPKDLTLKFTDTASPNIWKDIIVTLSECAGGAIDYENDKPTNVDVVTDQNGNKYWARRFGTTGGRWMLQNLRATTFDPVRTGDFANGATIEGWTEDISVNPTHGINTGTTYNENKWVRPYSQASGLEMTEAEFANNTDLGLLYDFSAALALLPSTEILQNGEKVQGMCPAGWRVPSMRDYMNLLHELNNNTQTHSTATAPANAALKLEGVDYTNASPGTQLFKSGATYEEQTALLASMVDVCLLPDSVTANLPHSSPKFMGGFSMLFTPTVYGGAYEVAESNKILSIWAPSHLQQLGTRIMAESLFMMLDNATGLLNISNPWNDAGVKEMKIVRCMQD